MSNSIMNGLFCGRVRRSFSKSGGGSSGTSAGRPKISLSVSRRQAQLRRAGSKSNLCGSRGLSASRRSLCASQRSLCSSRSNLADRRVSVINHTLPQQPSYPKGLESSAVSSSSSQPLGSGSTGTGGNASRTDTYRLSMAVLEDSPDVDLDAILGELCALETQFEKEIGDKSRPTSVAKTVSGSESSGPASVGSVVIGCPSRKALGNGARPKYEMGFTTELDWTQRQEKGARTDSPDNDSAFSDNMSMLSSESSASSGGSGGSGARTEVSKSSSGICSTSSPTSQAEQAARIKAEKIKLALEKIKEANVKKLFIKVFCEDGSTKSLLVDEKMSVSHVARMMSEKSHTRLEPRWAIVEYLPDLLMERVYEDHECLVENLMLWTRDSKNQLFFQERPDKCDLFTAPDIILLPPEDRLHSHLDDEAKSLMVEEFFASGDGLSVPEVESELWLKAEGKKVWKRYHFVLRASGIYYSPKGKIKCSKDLICLATFDMNQVYHGIGWRKKFKAPSEYCMAIKHPHIQMKAPKHIRYLCADDPTTLRRWIMAIRIAKFGRQLQDNYRQLCDDLTQDDIDRLAHARSVSVTSVAPSSTAGTPGKEGITMESTLAALSEQSELLSDRSSLSSRCSSRHQDSVISSRSGGSGSSAKSSPDLAFDSDHPQGGTIRRKPSLAPKLPLTSTTRLLVKADAEAADTLLAGGDSGEGSCLVMSSPGGGGTLTRRRERRTTDTLRSTGSSRSADSRTGSLRSTGSSGGRSVDTVVLVTRCPSVNSGGSNVPVMSPTADLSVASGGFDSGSDADSLPPPPPDLAGSTLSLSSLPPPPEELLAAAASSGSCSATALLPPRPPAFVPQLSRPESPPPALPAPMPHIEPIYSTGVVAAASKAQQQQRRPKKISFGGATEIPPVASGYSSPSRAPPPPPPKRSQSTRLSVSSVGFSDINGQSPPCRLATSPSAVAPPGEFLRDLQRVMHKKWTLAEKCKVDLKSPHEVLGFRDTLGGAAGACMEPNKEHHVDQWLQQHYGAPVYSRPAAAAPLYDMPRSLLKKMPPPPPRRKDSQLTGGR